MPNSRNASFRTWGDVLNFLTPYYRFLAQRLRRVEHLSDADLYKVDLNSAYSNAQDLQRQIREAIEVANPQFVGQDIPRTTRLPKGCRGLIKELRHNCTI